MILVDSLPIHRINLPDHLPGVEAWTLPPACSHVDDDAMIGDSLQNALHFLGGVHEGPDALPDPLRRLLDILCHGDTLPSSCSLTNMVHALCAPEPHSDELILQSRMRYVRRLLWGSSEVGRIPEGSRSQPGMLAGVVAELR